MILAGCPIFFVSRQRLRRCFRSAAKACACIHSLTYGCGKKVLDARRGCFHGTDDCGARSLPEKNQADTYQHIDVHLEEGEGDVRRRRDFLSTSLNCRTEQLLFIRKLVGKK